MDAKVVTGPDAGKTIARGETVGWKMNQTKAPEGRQKINRHPRQPHEIWLQQVTKFSPFVPFVGFCSKHQPPPSAFLPKSILNPDFRARHLQPQPVTRIVVSICKSIRPAYDAGELQTMPYFAILVIAAGAAFFYRAAEFENESRLLWCGLSLVISLVMMFCLRLGWLGALLGQIGLFAGITLFRIMRKS
jgi:hypothetical protein